MTLVAERRTSAGIQRISGESNIPRAEGSIERIFLEPSTVRAYPPTISAILGAHMIVFGPGSLFTSILPNFLFSDIVQAIRAASAPCVYICNIAMQPGETNDFSVADHVAVLEKYIGTNVIDIVVCNDTFPDLPPESKTRYVPFTDLDRARLTNYQLLAADLTDPVQPWRHAPGKLARVLLEIVQSNTNPISFKSQ